MTKTSENHTIVLGANWLEYSLIAALIGVVTLTAITLLAPPMEPSLLVPELPPQSFDRA